MPRGKENANELSDPRKNKMEAVRQAMDTLGPDAAPLKIREHVKTNFDQDMTPNMVSTYKAKVREKLGLPGRRKKHKGAKKSATAVAAPAKPVTPHDAVPWKDLHAIKDLAGRLGKKNLHALLEFLE